MDDLTKTKQLQHEIRQTLKVLNWSQPAFASYYHDEHADYDDEIENKRAVERFKSYLKRSETSPERLEPYLEFLKESERYNKFRECSSRLLDEIKPYQGLITDYQSILDEESDPTNKKVLGLAAAYALSIGEAFDFHVVKITENELCYEYQYLVIWVTVARHGGSGSYGPAMCEVSGVDMKRLSVEPNCDYFDVGTRLIFDVIGYKNQQLIVIGLDRDEENWQLHHTPLVYEVLLERSIEGRWIVVDREFIGRIDDDCNDVRASVEQMYSKAKMLKG